MRGLAEAPATLAFGLKPAASVMALLLPLGFALPWPMLARAAALLGGADDQMLSYYIAQYTNVDINWGMACALGAILLAATLVLYALYRRVVKSELSLG